LQQWLAAFEASDDFTRVMHKFAAWTEGQPVQLFRLEGATDFVAH
jgi:hypothetical protein